MEKIGVFGGTFNPVHLGHMRMALRFLQELGLDRVLVIPDRIPPHKTSEDLASPSDRLEMCRLAFRDCPAFQVSDLEILRQGDSYTVDTLRQLEQLFPDSRFYLLMGGDMFLSFPQWKDYEEIARRAILCCMPRDGEAVSPDMREMEAFLEKKNARMILLQAHPIEISSTRLRKMIREGRPEAASYLDEAVWQYIKDKGLYKEGTP